MDFSAGSCPEVPLMQNPCPRLIVGIISLVVATTAAQTAPAEAGDALAVIEKLGGKAFREGQRPGKPVTKVYLGGTLAADADVAQLTPLSGLEELSLAGTRI